MSVYDSSFLAGGISGDLLEYPWVTSTGLVQPGTSPAVFTVTAETGQRFNVTVEEITR